MQEKGLSFTIIQWMTKKGFKLHKRNTYHKTVPIITKETSNGEELIGGYDDLVKTSTAERPRKRLV